MWKRGLFTVLAIGLVLRMGWFSPTPAFGQGTGFVVLSGEYVRVGSTVYHLDFLNAPFGWRQMPYLDFTLPPVPVTSLVSLTDRRAITDTGEGWMLRNGWESAGQIPGTVSVERSSWGAVKARYR